MELSVKAGDAGQGIPCPGTKSALAIKTLMAQWAVAIHSSSLFSRLKAIVWVGHFLYRTSSNVCLS
jgi:hypothetical protein